MTLFCRKFKHDIETPYAPFYGLFVFATYQDDISLVYKTLPLSHYQNINYPCWLVEDCHKGVYAYGDPRHTWLSKLTMLPSYSSGHQSALQKRKKKTIKLLYNIFGIVYRSYRPNAKMTAASVSYTFKFIF